jgi:ABC-type transport system substrate-binding protein
VAARVRRGARTGPGVAAWRVIGGWGAAALLVASLVSGCGSQPATPAPPAAASPAATVRASPTPTPTPVAYADTMRVGWNTNTNPESFRGLALATWSPSINYTSLVYSGLYRYDDHLNAVPDLADGPCLPQADPMVIRCRIIDTSFHDGTPLTADDVAYTFRLFSAGGFASIWTGRLIETRVVDPKTVDFVLSAVDPTFLTERLPAVPILSRHAVEAAYADFVARTKDLTAEGLQQLVDTIGEELGRDPPACTTRLDEMETLLAKLGARLYREDYPQANGTLDPCWWMAAASEAIQYVAWALGASGPEATMQALVFFGLFRPLPGTGPYRLVSQAADRVHFEAWPDYQGGIAATRYLDFVAANGDGSDLVAGTIDVSQSADLGSAFAATAPSRGLQIARPLQPTFFALTFNTRPGRLFADLALRRALQMCIDLSRDVDAATGGAGIPIYSPVLPGSWGDDPDLPKPDRDVADARRLIEASGWQLGSDGVYAKDGVSLAAEIPVRGDRAERVKMADLIAAQARDCGMDLESLRLDDYGSLLTYPHFIPGTKTPFDIFLVGLTYRPDPGAVLAGFASSQVTDVEHPDVYANGNMGGFRDVAYDRLVEAGAAAYDQAARTTIYRQAQRELASQLPAIFLWAGYSTDYVRSAVMTTSGPLDPSVPDWAWQPERLVVVSNP